MFSYASFRHLPPNFLPPCTTSAKDWTLFWCLSGETRRENIENWSQSKKFTHELSPILSLVSDNKIGVKRWTKHNLYSMAFRVFVQPRRLIFLVEIASQAQLHNGNCNSPTAWHFSNFTSRIHETQFLNTDNIEIKRYPAVSALWICMLTIISCVNLSRFNSLPAGPTKSSLFVMSLSMERYCPG